MTPRDAGRTRWVRRGAIALLLLGPPLLFAGLWLLSTVDRGHSPSIVEIREAGLTVGIVAVAAAPLFLVRRIRRMDIPDTLRVME